MIKTAVLLVAFVTLASGRLVAEESRIAKINSLHSTWTAHVNPRFANLTVDEAKRLLGVFPGKHPFVPRMEPRVVNAAIPTDFDSRTNWPKCSVISQIRDQSACGSCWAFGTAEAASDRLCIASAGAVNTGLSTEALVSCCGFSCGDGCNGGYPESAWQYVQGSGLPTETAYPYAFPSCEHHTTGSKPPCGQEQPTPKCEKSHLSGKRYHASSVYAVAGSIEEIQTEIMNNGPVTGAFTVMSDFPNYKSGVYQHTTDEELGGHAIKIFGWGVENGTPYWHVANSWNEDWGDKGTFKILRGSDECGIESNMVAGKMTTN